MIPKRIAGATHNLGPPPGMTAEQCSRLFVRIEMTTLGPVAYSAWEPTPAELEALKAGGHVLLGVVGGQPPVILSVEPPAASEEMQEKVP